MNPIASAALWCAALVVGAGAVGALPEWRWLLGPALAVALLWLAMYLVHWLPDPSFRDWIRRLFS